MLNFDGPPVEVYSFSIALRWAQRKGFPQNIKTWTEKENEWFNNVVQIIDERRKTRYKSRT